MHNRVPKPRPGRVMMTMMAAGWVAALSVGPACPGLAQPVGPDAPRVEPRLDWSGDGPRVMWGDQPVALDLTPSARRVVLERRTVPEGEVRWQREWEPAELESRPPQVDAGQQRVTRRDGWGEMRARYELANNHLRLELEVENRTDHPIAQFNLRLMTLNLPNRPQLLNQKQHESTLDRPLVYTLPAPQGKLYVACETFEPPLHFGIDTDTPEASGRYPLYITGGVNAFAEGAVTIPPKGVPTIPPGRTLKLAFSLSFAGEGAHDAMVLRPYYQRYRRFHEPMFDWPDRRPIGAAFLLSEYGKQATRFGQEGTNPRRWFSPQLDTVEVDSPEGRAMLRRELRQLAYNTVHTLKKLDAQGTILWNVEGGFHTTGWVGETDARAETDTPQFAEVVPPLGEILNSPELEAQRLDGGFQ